MKAVVCDDDPTVRSVITTMLEQHGHEVLAETDTGPDAVELVCRFAAELLVLDLSLGAGTGYEVLRAIRERRPETVVVVFTAFAHDPEQEGSLLAAGARTVLHKPDFGELEEALLALGTGQGVDRRVGGRALPAGLRQGPRTPAGIDTEADFARACAAAIVDDVAFVASIEGAEQLAREHGAGWLVDSTAELARTIRRALRVQDLVYVARPGVVQALVLPGQPGVADKIARRLRSAWEEVSELPVHLAWSEVVADGGGAAALERATVGPAPWPEALGS